MKKLAIFLILCLILILLISCGENASNTSSVTTQQTSEPMPSISTTQPSSVPSPAVSTTLPTTTKAPITSTSKATETQPISTSETTETDPMINSGFSLPSGLISCPLFIVYEMPRSCSLSDETVSITLYISLHEPFLLDDASEEDYFEIYLQDNESLFQYPLCNPTTKEVRSKNYVYKDSGPLFPSQGEPFEIPLSIFSEEQSNRWSVVVDYYKEDNTWCGCNSYSLAYEKNNGGTIVFRSARPYPNTNSEFHPPVSS